MIIDIDLDTGEEIIIRTNYKGKFTGTYIFKPKLVMYDYNNDEFETKYSMQFISQDNPNQSHI